MTGKTVLVTGGTRGIGAVTAKLFQAKGYRVVSNYVHNDEAASEFRTETNIPIYRWDVADHGACTAGVRRIQEEVGNIDVLVNNAGITRDHTLQKMTIDEWKSVIETDLSSCFYMCRAVIDSMRSRGFGRIVNLSSIVGVAGHFGQTNYSAAKAGILGFTKSLALETASHGITVNAIEPGFIDTEMLSSIPEDMLKTIVERIPVKRLGHPEEVARAILFLTDDEAGFITGETLAVNGGMHMG